MVIVVGIGELAMYAIVVFVPLYALLSIYVFFFFINSYGPHYAPTLSKYLVKILALILAANLMLLGILGVIDIKLSVNVGVSVG